MPTRNPADKVHYIVRFRDWGLTHSVTLALDVPKMGTIGSGEFNNRRPLAFQPSFSFQGPIRKIIQYFLVVNIWIGRTAPWISLLRNKTIRISRSTGMCIIHIGDLSIEKIRRPETKRNVYLFYLVIQLNQRVVIVADSNNHFIQHAYFWFSNGFTSFINGNFLM